MRRHSCVQTHIDIRAILSSSMAKVQSTYYYQAYMYYIISVRLSVITNIHADTVLLYLCVLQFVKDRVRFVFAAAILCLCNSTVARLPAPVD